MMKYIKSARVWMLALICVGAAVSVASAATSVNYYSGTINQNQTFAQGLFSTRNYSHIYGTYAYPRQYFAGYQFNGSPAYYDYQSALPIKVNTGATSAKAACGRTLDQTSGSVTNNCWSTNPS